MQSLLPKKFHKKTNLMEVKLTIHSIYWNMDLMLTRLDTYNKWINYFNRTSKFYMTIQLEERRILDPLIQ
jgi:hypothetical protein